LALSLAELLAAVDRVLRTVARPDMHEVVPRALDIPGAILVIRSVLALRARIRWTHLVQRGAEPWQILSTLLGLLELRNRGELRVDQPSPFAAVWITRDAASEPASGRAVRQRETARNRGARHSRARRVARRTSGSAR